VEAGEKFLVASRVACEGQDGNERGDHIGVDRSSLLLQSGVGFQRLGLDRLGSRPNVPKARITSPRSSLTRSRSSVLRCPSQILECRGESIAHKGSQQRSILLAQQVIHGGERPQHHGPDMRVLFATEVFRQAEIVGG
jgi:hypothetical protein